MLTLLYTTFLEVLNHFLILGLVSNKQSAKKVVKNGWYLAVNRGRM